MEWCLECWRGHSWWLHFAFQNCEGCWACWCEARRCQHLPALQLSVPQDTRLLAEQCPAPHAVLT